MFHDKALLSICREAETLSQIMCIQNHIASLKASHAHSTDWDRHDDTVPDKMHVLIQSQSGHQHVRDPWLPPPMTW